MGLLFGPWQGSLRPLVLLLTHGGTDVKHSHLVLCCHGGRRHASMQPAASLQEGQSDIAQPGHKRLSIFIKAVQGRLLCAVGFPVVKDLAGSKSPVNESVKVVGKERGFLVSIFQELSSAMT